MREEARWLFAAVVLACCSSPPADRGTPEGAFASLAPCVDGADAACLMDRLDRDSRWSVHSIHRTLAAARAAVERSYPADRRAAGDVFGSWGSEAAAADPHAMFTAFCERRRGLETVARGFAAVPSVRPVREGLAEVTTTRDVTFPMAAVQGEWGLAAFRDELHEAKIRLADVLAQVERDAAAYDEQRLATGAPAP